MIQLLVRAARESRIRRNRKTNLSAAFHADDDPAIYVSGGLSCVS